MNILYKLIVSAGLLAFAVPAMTFAASYDWEEQQEYEEELWDSGWNYIEYVSWELNDSFARNVVMDDGGGALEFELDFTLTAKDEDVYIPLSVRRVSEEFGGFTADYAILVNGVESPFTSTSIPDSKATVGTDADIVNGHAYIPAESSADFVVSMIGVPAAETTGYIYNAKVSFVSIETDESKLYKNELEEISLFSANSYGLTNQMVTDNVVFTPGTGVGKDEQSEDEDEDIESVRHALLKQIQSLLLQIIELQKIVAQRQ